MLQILNTILEDCLAILQCLNMQATIRKRYNGGFIILFLFFAVSRVSFSQNLVNVIYNSEDGLPSSNVYCVEQDTLGYIWAITDYGLSRYNGEVFTNYDMSNGFPDRGGYHIYKDKKGVLWFIPYNGRICYFDGKTFKPSRFLNEENNEPVSWILEDSQNNTCYTTRTGKLIICHPNGEIIKINISNNLVYCVAEISPNIYLVLHENKLSWVNGKTRSITTIENIYNDFTKSDYPRLKRLKNGKLLFIASKGIYEVKENFTFKLVISCKYKLGESNEIYNVYEDDEGCIWMPGRKGLLKFDSTLSNKKYKLYFKDYNILTVIKDNEDDLWIATTWGLLKVLSEGAYYFSKNDGIANDHFKRIYKTKENAILAINYIGSIYSVEKNKISLIGKNSLTTAIDAHTFDAIGKNKLFIGSNAQALIFDLQTSLYKVISNTRDPKLYLKYQKDTLFFVDYNGAGLINSDKKKYYYKLPGNSVFGSLPKTLAKDNEGCLWLGSKNSLIKITPAGKCINVTQTVPACGTGVTQILITTKGNVWVASSADIIYCISRGKVTEYKLAMPLITRIRNITLSNDSILWVATNNGAHKFYIDKNNNLNKIFCYNTDNALVSNDINDIVEDGANVYFATNRGISVINQNLYRLKNIHPGVVIHRLTLGEVDINLHAAKSVEVDYKNNSLNVNLEATVYSWGKIAYKYKLEPLDTGWEFSQSSNIKYSILPPGQYTFRVKMANLYGYESNKEETFGFFIKKPYWQTVWFWTLILLTITIVVYLLIKKRLDVIRQKSDLQKGLIEAQLKALRLQMNPHFIFNTLQSVQDYIITHQNTLAVNYLSKFSKLIRKALDYSKHNLITLQEDLDMLDLYIELEKVRFNGKLEFIQKIDNQVNAQRVLIPPMIIQPFIENAIKHGVSPLSEGIIELSVYNQDACLIVEIKDNGIGRVAADKTGQLKHGHKSTGIRQTKERLGMVFTNYNLKGSSIDIMDLYDGERPEGTQVVIKIPYANG